MKNLCLIACLSVCSALGSAQTTKEFPYDSGNVFLRLCSSVEKAQRTDAETQLGAGCLLYIAGFVDGAETGNVSTMVQMKPTTIPKPFCRPDNTENGQLVKIVLKYIREHPEDAHQPTGLIVLWAFQRAFPCLKTMEIR
jgi:hypothetical protein